MAVLWFIGGCTLSAVQCAHDGEARDHIPLSAVQCIHKGETREHKRWVQPHMHGFFSGIAPYCKQSKPGWWAKAWEEETIPYLEDHGCHGNLSTLEYKVVLNQGWGLGPKLGYKDIPNLKGIDIP